MIKYRLIESKFTRCIFLMNTLIDNKSSIDNKKAVVVLSGGLDSATCMGIAQKMGFELFPITFHYEQRHSREVSCAQEVAKHYNSSDKHKIVDLPFLGNLGASSLTNMNLEIRQSDSICIDNCEIPNTYVPARNLIFLSLATAYAEVLGAKDIFIGVSAVDYSGYPDCRPEFIEAMDRTINLATKVGVSSNSKLTIRAPLMYLDKQQTIELGLQLGVPYKLTTSCYKGLDKACGECDSCLFRLKGFAANRTEDLIPYL